MKSISLEICVKFAVDFQSASGRPTGIGMFAANLLASIAAADPSIELVRYSSGKSDLRVPERIWWESVEIPRRLLRDRPALLYSPGFAPPFFSSVPRVVTVHDLIGMVYAGNQGGWGRVYWSKWLPAALKRAERIVASSESTRRDIRRFLGIPEERVEVVPLAANPCFRKNDDRSTIDPVLERYGLRSRPYFLTVGSLEPRKNLPRLIEAYGLLQRAGRDTFDLVLAGKPAGGDRELDRLIRDSRLGGRVRRLGYVDDADLAALYNASLGYACVSLYEGFGLPPLEAMSCGKSGVCSDRSSLPEVTGDTALAVDPENVGQIADALSAYAADPGLRTRLERAAHERAGTFSSARMAGKMIEIFREVAGR